MWCTICISSVVFYVYRWLKTWILTCRDFSSTEKASSRHVRYVMVNISSLANIYYYMYPHIIITIANKVLVSASPPYGWTNMDEALHRCCIQPDHVLEWGYYHWPKYFKGNNSREMLAPYSQRFSESGSRSC